MEIFMENSDNAISKDIRAASFLIKRIYVSNTDTTALVSIYNKQEQEARVWFYVPLKLNQV
jgi:hypothetical protein